MTKIEALLRSGQNIFTTDDLALYWQQDSRDQVLESARAYANRSKLWRIRQGIYSLNQDYQPVQLAAKLHAPSYITGWYVLTKAGVVFQYYGACVTSFALRSRKYIVDGREYIYRQVKREILFNDLGISKGDNYWIACPERAVIDVLYHNKELSFDNLSALDARKMRKIAKIYGQASLSRRLEKLLEGVGPL
jgi:hypothetical protein